MNKFTIREVLKKYENTGNYIECSGAFTMSGILCFSINNGERNNISKESLINFLEDVDDCDFMICGYLKKDYFKKIFKTKSGLLKFIEKIKNS